MAASLADENEPRRYFGSYASGDARFADNERIDVDLAKAATERSLEPL